MRKPFLTILFSVFGLLVFAQQSKKSVRLSNPVATRIEASRTKKLDLAINSNYQEYNPLISPDHDLLYFSRKGDPQNMGIDDQSDIWVAYREMDGQWGRAINLGGAANDRNGNQLAGVNSKGNVLYIANYNKENQLISIVNSTQVGRSWSIPQTISIYTDTLLRDLREFSFSADGKHMLFTAAQEATEYRDIYVSHFNADTGWSVPENLDIPLSSDGTKVYPYLATDSKTLYFSAQEYTGYGGLDIYVCRRQKDTWTSWSIPENLGPEINTPNDEYSCSLPASGDYIYYTSGDSLQSNIYQSFLSDRYRPGAVVLLSGKILNGETYETLPVALNVKALNEEGNTASSIFIEEGNFHLLVPEGTDLGLYAAAQDGYFPVSELMEMSNAGLEELDGNQAIGEAGVEEGMIYSYSSREIEKNKLQLRQRNEEIQKMERNRRKANYPQIKDPLHPKIPLRSRYRSNPQLDALRQQYQKMEEEKKNKLSSSTQIKGKELNARGKQTPQLTDQYDEEGKQIDRQPQTPSSLPPADEELEELRKKFNRFYYREASADASAAQKNARERYQIAERDKAFEKLERKMLRQLKKELRDEVMLELQKELVEPELIKAQKEMPLSSRRLINKQLKKTVKEELKRRLVEKEVRNEEKETDSTSFEKDLKEVLSLEAKSELKEELTEYLREEIKKELNYQLKKIEQKQLGLALQNNIYQYKTDKKRKVSNGSDPLPEVNALANPTLTAEEVEKEILLLPLKSNQVIPLNNIFFEANTAILKEASYNELERIEALLSKNTAMQVEISGHTNSWVEEALANQITTNRAAAVRDYLIEQGVQPERIKIKGHGSERPLISNSTVIGRKKNQRIELKILNLD